MKKIFTIGFAGKDARTFFTTLKKNRVVSLIDIRLNNVSQLAGYTKKNDLDYFLTEICNIMYLHDILYAPTKEILDDYKKKIITWTQYEEQYLSLLNCRNIITHNRNIDFDQACLLCSEKTHENCHRSLLANYFLENKIVDKVIHL